MTTKQLEAEVETAKAAAEAADAARNIITDDTPDEVCAPLNAAYFAALDKLGKLNAALIAARRTPAQAAAAAEQQEASRAQLAAEMSLLRKDRHTPAFPVRCQCGGVHGVNADKTECDDCRT